MLAWILCGVLGAAVVALMLRLFSIQQGLRAMTRELKVLLRQDTNGLISVSSGDRSLRLAAAELNRLLVELKKQSRRYFNGDRELKDAVTNISHDLRTPLTAISGYLELLEREPKSPDVARYIACISERTNAMKQLTEELFRYSVILSTSEDMELKPVDVCAALEESLAGFYGALTERGILPEITIPSQKIVRKLNREALSRVFGNILGNALKYSYGDLSVLMDDSGNVSFSNTAKNLGGVDVGKLFDRFFSVEAARNSTGLGLSIAKALVERMGGTVDASMDGEILTIKIEWGEE